MDDRYLLIPLCRVLLEKLTGLQLVKKFPAFHGTRRFITALTSVRHLSLSCASPIQSVYSHPTAWRSILILSTHLRLVLPSGFFLSGFPTKTLYSPSPHPYASHAPFCIIIILGYMFNVASNMTERLYSVFVKPSDELAVLKFENDVSKLQISNFLGHIQCLLGSRPRLHKMLLQRGQCL